MGSLLAAFPEPVCDKRLVRRVFFLMEESGCPSVSSLLSELRRLAATSYRSDVSFSFSEVINIYMYISSLHQKENHVDCLDVNWTFS